MNYAEFPPLHHLLEKLQAIPRAKSFIAHPGYKGKQWEKFWKDWKSLGLSGLELIHPSHKGPLRKYYKKIIRRENLIAVGGSDFHFSGGGRIGPGKLGLDFHQWKNFNDQCQLLHNNHLVDKNLPETATIIRSPEDKNELSE